MHSDYSLEALKAFIAFVRDKGLASKSTSTGWQVAVNKVLDHLSEGEESDVRAVDLDAALRRFSNKNPNLLSPKSLNEYRRRVAQVIAEFVQWKEDPTAYKPRGRGATPARRKEPGGLKRDGSMQRQAARHTSLPAPPAHPASSASASLSLVFPLRADFLAQITVPRDIKTDEARRLGAFLLTLSADYAPAS